MGTAAPPTRYCLPTDYGLRTMDCSFLRRQRQTHRPLGSPFQRPMHHPRVGEKIQSRGRISQEELLRHHIPLQSITRSTRDHEISRRVGAAFGERVDVVDRREVEVEGRAAVDTAATAVAHHGALERAAVFPPEDLADLALKSTRGAWEWNAVSAML